MRRSGSKHCAQTVWFRGYVRLRRNRFVRFERLVAVMLIDTFLGQWGWSISVFTMTSLQKKKTRKEILLHKGCVLTSSGSIVLRQIRTRAVKSCSALFARAYIAINLGQAAKYCMCNKKLQSAFMNTIMLSRGLPVNKNYIALVLR